MRAKTTFEGFTRFAANIDVRSRPWLFNKLQNGSDAANRIKMRLMQMDRIWQRRIAIAAVVLILAILNFEYATGNDLPSVKRFCNKIRDTALEECANAFEDSYYKGGFSGKDMDWRLIKDGQRCQKLGTDMYFSCLKNK